MIVTFFHRSCFQEATVGVGRRSDSCGEDFGEDRMPDYVHRLSHDGVCIGH